MKLPVKRIARWLGAALVLGVAFTGCYKEDTSDCFNTLEVSFRLAKGGTTNLFPTEVESVSVFVFDENGIYVGRWDEFDRSKFTADYVMKVDLADPGKYSLVAWGGLHDDHYRLYVNGAESAPVPGVTTRDQLLVWLQRRDGILFGSQRSIIDYHQANQYHGCAEDVEIIRAQRVTRTEINLTKNSNTLRLTLEGLPKSAGGDYSNIEMYLEAVNGRCDYSNIIPSSAGCLTYLPQNSTVDGADALHTDIYTQRLVFHENGGAAYRLVIRDTESGATLFDDDILKNYIRKVPAYSTQQAVDNEDLYQITLTVRIGVTVTINGWDLNSGGSNL